ncbi:hypothetical protein VB735_29815 [Halotia wernerae UHCC 0503]|nr:hypothetical protein [Halotia wernerae UHCC 0503]
MSQAHQWLQRIAECLHYPEHTSPSTDDVTDITQTAKLPLTSFQVQREMEELLQQFVPDPQQKPAGKTKDQARPEHHQQIFQALCQLTVVGQLPHQYLQLNQSANTHSASRVPGKIEMPS